MNVIKTRIQGMPACQGEAEGKAKVITNPVQEFEGDILVVKETNPDYTPHMYSSKGIIGEVGGILNHLSIVSREAGIPSITSVDNATRIISDGDLIRMDATTGIIDISSPPFVRLTDPRVANTPYFGGKSKGLHELLNQGLLVPEGYAFDYRLIRQFRPEDVEKLVSQMNLNEEELFAVRSSATNEDSVEKSFAGQNATFLRINYQNLPQKIVEVMTKTSRRLDVYSAGEESKIGVVVQKCIDPTFAGVLFTKNPVTGDCGQGVIELSEGNGEKLVSGEITPSTYFVDLESMSVTQSFNDKGMLTSKILEELVQVGGKMKTVMGCEADIEFCYEKGKIYYLQARPITT